MIIFTLFCFIYGQNIMGSTLTFSLYLCTFGLRGKVCYTKVERVGGMHGAAIIELPDDVDG